MDLGFKNKVVVVTGGASNIGRSISQEFAKEGAHVVILDRDMKQGEKTADEIVKAGGKAVLYELDVTDVDATKAVIDKVESKEGPIEVLVNNVGWNSPPGFFLSFGPEHWDKQFKLNLFSAFNVTHATLPHMVKRRGGAIVSIASDAAIRGVAMSDYSAVKAGVLAFGRVIAEEYGRYGIRSNLVAPGVTIPEPGGVGEGSLWKGGDALSPEQIEKTAATTPLKKLPEPGDIATAVLFLASEKAKALTGQFLSVSCGYVMPR